MWFDSHCHLNDPAFAGEVDQIIFGANEVGVTEMLVVGCDLESSCEAVKLAAAHAGVWAAVGIHPHDAKPWNQAVAREIEELLCQPKVVALGEIGLDYHYEYSTKDDQLLAFNQQLAMAKECGKPVIIHNREAHADTLKVLDEIGLGSAGGVMHCFSGSQEIAAACLDKGLEISFAGAITFRNAHKLAAVAAWAPLEHVLVETDSPYLTPHPFRGTRNNPALVKLVGEKLAELKGIPVEQVMETTRKNCHRLFGISPSI